MRSLNRLALFFAGLGVFAAVLCWLMSSGVAEAQDASCAGARVIIEGGEPSPFVLPDGVGRTLRIEPSATLTLRGENLPPGASLRLAVAGLGVDVSINVGNLSSGEAQVRVADYSEHLRGLYQVEVVLLANGVEVCRPASRVQVSGFSGTVATAASGASAVTGVAALATAAYSASGVRAKVNLNAQIKRRRPMGWRHWMPVPAWKRIIFSTITGSILGLCLSIVLQQRGIYPLSLVSAIWGAVIGGGAALGVGYSIGAIWTYVRPPKAD